MNITISVKFFKPDTGKFSHEEILTATIDNWNTPVITEFIKERYRAATDMDFMSESWNDTKTLYNCQLIKCHA